MPTTGVAVPLLVGIVAAVAVAAVWRWRPRLLAAPAPALTAAVAAAAIVGGAWSTSPATTAITGVDAALRAILVAVAVAAGAAARPWAWVVAAAVVAPSAAPGAPSALAFAALGAAVAGARLPNSPLLGAVVGGLVGTAALGLAWPSSAGATSLVAAVAVALLVGSAWRRSAAAVRRAAGGAAVAVLAGAVAVCAAYGAAAAGERTRLETAVDDAEQGLAAARAGDVPVAERAFAEAAASINHVEARLGRWWLRPVRWVPVVSANVRAFHGALATAGRLADAGADVARAGDVRRIHPRGGRVDLDELRSFDRPLTRALRLLAAAEVDLRGERSPWLAPALAAGLDDLADRIASSRSEAGRGLHAVRVVPRLLGAGGEQRWFLGVMTPSELRGGGGFIGNWGILTAADGRLELPVFGRIHELYRPTPYGVRVDPEFDARYLQRFGLDRWPQNVLASPHLPSSAVAIDQVLQAAGIGPVDGVIVVDPYGMAALLQLTGPVAVDGWPEPLTPQSAPPVLLHDQYLRAQDPTRQDFLAQATQTLFDRLTDGDLPPPPDIAAALAPAVAGGHLQLFTFDAVGQRFLRRLGATAELDRPVGDALGIVTHNAAAGKLDWFLRRRVTYDVEIDAGGRLSGTVEARLENLAPADLPDNGYLGEASRFGVGTNRLFVSLYTAARARDLTVDGQTVEPDPSAERGHRVYDHFVTIPPGGESTMLWKVGGRVPIVDGEYRLDVHRQPTAAPDHLTVVVNGRTVFDGDHDRDLTLHADL